jgi:Fe-S-cluster containining protein
MLWISRGRTDILRHVQVRFRDGRRVTGTNVTREDLSFPVSRIHLWIGDGGGQLRCCPFFHRGGDGKVYCRIHDVKPQVCTGFTPWAEGIRDYALNCPACRESAP